MYGLRPVLTLIAAISVALVVGPGATRAAGQGADRKGKKPSLSVRASPLVAFTPAKIFFTGELKGGSDDYADLYCATVEWDWGDDTTSESTVQCEPYEAGKSEIKRRYSIQHEFKVAGAYRVQLRLKKKNKVILASQVMLQINPGIRDPWR